MSPAAIELFVLCQQIIKSGKHETWEENGGRRAEYLQASVDLNRMLGFRPWQPDVLDAASPEPPAYVTDRAAWQQAHEVHSELASRCPADHVRR